MSTDELRSKVSDQIASMIADVRSMVQDGIQGLSELIRIVGTIAGWIVKIMATLGEATGQEKKDLAVQVLTEVYDQYVDPMWNPPGPDAIYNTVVHAMIPGLVELAYTLTKPLLSKGN